MNGKERVQALLNGEPADRVGFWLGNPTDETKQIYNPYFGITGDDTAAGERKAGEDSIRRTTKAVEADIELACKLNSDLFWCSPELDPLAWKHPEGKPMFDVLGAEERQSLGQAGIIAECVNAREVEDYEWPNPDYLDFTSTIETIDRATENGMAIWGGMWMPFFHIVAFFLGMENYFMKMHTHPKVCPAGLPENRRAGKGVRPEGGASFVWSHLKDHSQID